jgi:hypothetical protein
MLRKIILEKKTLFAHVGGRRDPPELGDSFGAIASRRMTPRKKVPISPSECAATSVSSSAAPTQGPPQYALVRHVRINDNLFIHELRTYNDQEKSQSPAPVPRISRSALSRLAHVQRISNRQLLQSVFGGRRSLGEQHRVCHICHAYEIVS